MAQKLPSYLALVSICFFVLIFISVFRKQPWQKVLIKHINIEQSVQILEPHQEYSKQSPGKPALKEATAKREGTKVVPKYISLARRSQGLPKFKLRRQNQANSMWDNPDDFWNMTYEERSKVVAN